MMYRHNTLITLFVSLFCLSLFQVVQSQQYPVPIPPHGRQSVHGWLILPLDQDLPNWRDTSEPVDAWFSHHVPEFYTTSPHDFQIILRGKLNPLPHAGNVTVPILLPYPPKHELVQYEYTFTPPPPFSLNDLLAGTLTDLQGVVYNGSFDTSYERIPMAIAHLHIESLATAFWLNYSSAVVPYESLRYYSYPRTTTFNQNQFQHFYFAHSIHAAPDFDQIIHAIVDLGSCICNTSLPENQYCTLGSVPDLFDILSDPGISWSFPDISNLVEDRLLAGQQVRGISLLSQNAYQCDIHVLEEIHCMIGPGFNQKCGTYEYYDP